MFYFFSRAWQLSGYLGFSACSVASSATRVNSPIRAHSGGFVLESALIEGNQPHLSLENILILFMGECQRGDKLSQWEFNSNDLVLCSLPVFVFGTLLHLYFGILISGIYFTRHLLNLMQAIISGKLESQASPTPQWVKQQRPGGLQANLEVAQRSYWAQSMKL